MGRCSLCAFAYSVHVFAEGAASSLVAGTWYPKASQGALRSVWENLYSHVGYLTHTRAVSI